MAPAPDAPDEDRRGPALAGPLLHQRAAFRTPGPGRRIDELDAPDSLGDVDATTPARSEEDDAG